LVEIETPSCAVSKPISPRESLQLQFIMASLSDSVRCSCSGHGRRSFW